MHVIIDSYVTYILSGHSFAGTHSLESSSMIVPAGHSHTPLQIIGQNLKSNLLVHVVAHLGSIPHCFTICPLTVQFPVKLMVNIANFVTDSKLFKIIC